MPLSPASASRPEASALSSSGSLPLTRGINPRTADERSRVDPITSMRTPYARRCDGAEPPPPSSIGHPAARHAPVAAGAAHGANGVTAAGLTTVPLRRTAPSSVTRLGGDSPELPDGRPGLAVGRGGDRSLPADHDRAAGRREAAAATRRAAALPAIVPCTRTPPANAIDTAIPTAGSSQRPGRRCARANNSVHIPLTARPGPIASAGSAHEPWLDRRRPTSSTIGRD